MGLNTKRASGLVAKREGQKWERIFEAVADSQGVTVIRVPDGCRRVGRFKLVQVKSPFDYVLGYGDKIACVDLKSFGSGSSITYSQINQDQINALYAIGQHGLSGYVVNFREIDKIAFFDAHTLRNCIPKKGISIENATQVLGSLSALDARKMFF